MPVSPHPLDFDRGLFYLDPSKFSRIYELNFQEALMKKILLLTSCVLISSISFAGGFVGKVGPFEKNEYSTKDFHFRKCDDTIRSLTFNVEKTSKYHMPRIQVDTLTIQYSSGFEETLDVSALGETRGFNLQLNRAHGCPVHISMNAAAAGFIPTGILQSTLEIWTH